MAKKIECPIEFLCSILPRGKAEQADKILKSFGCDSNLITLASGTVKSRKASLFGFGISQREVLFGFVPTKKSSEILTKLNTELSLAEKDSGIAFTVPLKSATSSMAKILEMGEI